MNTKTSTPKIIYLDQKCWINLVKLSLKKSTKASKNILNKIINVSENNVAIFPISIDRVIETSCISNRIHREQLASLMVETSKGYCFTPYFNRIIEIEIYNLVLNKLKLPTINTQSLVLGKGIGHLVGAKPEIKGNITEEIKQFLLNSLDTPKTLFFALTNQSPSFIRNINETNNEGVEKMEQNRKKILQIEDKEKRWRNFLALNLREIVSPILAKILYTLQLPKNFIIKEDWTKKNFEDLVDNIPTALCLFTLIYQRDQHFQRPINVNDMADISSLTLAIPYSNIVVTDKMMASISKRMKLDIKCNTIILSSLKELEKHI